MTGCMNGLFLVPYKTSGISDSLVSVSKQFLRICLMTEEKNILVGSLYPNQIYTITLILLRQSSSTLVIKFSLEKMISLT
jgi:hypothetical protein